jgi:hypothetical protein
VGITEVPEAFRTDTASEVFDNLRKVLEYHPERRDEITHFWTVFELQTIEQTLPLEMEVVALVQQQRIDEARKLLTDFVAATCDQALIAARKMITELESLPICNAPPSLSD